MTNARNALNPKSDLARILAAMSDLSDIGFTTGVFEGCCRSCASNGDVPDDQTGQAWLFKQERNHSPVGFTKFGYITDEVYLYWMGDAMKIIATLEHHGLGGIYSGASQAIKVKSARVK